MDLAFELDLGTALDADAPQRLLELVGRRRRTDDAVAAVGAEDPEARPGAGARPVLEELRELLVGGGHRALGWAELEEQPLQLVDPGAGGGRGRDDADDPAVLDLEARRRLEQVDLVQDDELGALVETGAVRRELAIDRPEALLEIVRRGVDDVHEEPRTLEMREELVTEAGSLGGAFDEAGDIRDGELPRLRAVDGAEHRLDRRERVRGHLRLRVRDPAEQ